MPSPWSLPPRHLLPGRPTRNRPAAPRRSFPLRLEALEDRLVPASHTWTGAVDANWSTSGNWAGGAPAAGESDVALVFPAGAAHLSNVNDIPGLALQSVTFQAGGSSVLSYALDGEPFTVSGWILVDADTTGAVSIANSVGGAGSVTQSGGGTLTLAGSNSYTGGTTLNAGALVAAGGSAFGTGALALNFGTLSAASPVVLGNAFSVAGAVAVGGASNLTFTGPGTLSPASTLTVQNTAKTNFAGALSGGGQFVVDAGTGVVALAAGNVALFATTKVLSGILAIGPTSPGPGGITPAAFVPPDHTTALVVSNPGVTTLPGSIGGNAALVVAPGAGTVVLGAANSYSGPTVVEGGLLQQAAPGAIPAFSPLTVAAGATFDLGGFDTTVGDLTGGGTVLLDAPSLTAAIEDFASFGGSLTGTGGLTKVGNGTLILAGTSTYSGPTTVAYGTLLVDGAADFTPVSVVNGATLGGGGSVGSIALHGGVLRPEAAAGALTSAGDVTFDLNSTYTEDIDAYRPGSGYGQLRVVDGRVDLQNCKLTVNLNAQSPPALGTPFTLIQTSRPVLGTFDGLPEGGVLSVNGLAFQITYQGGAGHDVVLTRGVRSALSLKASALALETGQPLTLTATVTGLPRASVPTGNLTFYDGATPLGSLSLGGNGQASLNLPALSQADHDLSAHYDGDPIYLPAASPSLTLPVVAPAGDDGQFVVGLYHDLLGRAAQPGELTFFVPVLTAAELPYLPAIAGQFLATAEDRARVVQGYYDKLLHRVAGPDDVSFWSSGLAPPLGADWLAATIVSSPEYVQRRSVGDPDPNLGWLAAAYPDLLGRDLGPQDRAFWQQYFQLGITRSTVAYYLATSGEAHAQLVKGWYTTFLQRDAGLADLVFWAGQFAGRTDDQVEALIAGSPEAFQKAGNTNTEWVASLYANVLGRSVDAGLNYYLNILLGGSAAQRQALVGVLTGSAEYRQHRAALDLARYLKRDVSGAEAGYFAGLRQAGLTEEQVVAQIVASAEYFQKAGGSNEQWVNQLYQDLLDRPPSGAEAAYFVHTMAAGATRDQVAAVILGGGEYQSGLVGGLYTTYLGRAASGGELAYGAALLQAGLRDEDVLALLLTSGEYYLRPHAP